ncbi:MAG TPA: tetratricopeptide repeat protein, partial [Myxococcales bacterium]|nr:tetratricopeptide repeat protein [Myxococcales bacterium]
LDEALPLANRALRLAETKLGREHPATADALDNRADVLLEQGHPREALIDAERALAVRRKGKGSMVAEAFSLNTIGRAQLQLGRLPEAIASLERAASLKPPNAAVMADIELGLARALAAAHRDPARAQALAGSARSRFEQLHHARRLAELDAWLAAHGARGRR